MNKQDDPTRKQRSFHPVSFAIVVAVLIIVGLLNKNSDGQEPGNQYPSNTAIWTTSYQDAVEQANQTDVPIMLFFTGTKDWCPWCDRLEREVFGSQAFSDWAMNRVVLVRVEYPIVDKLPAPLASQNQMLITKYQKHIKGYPTILFLTPNETVVGRMGYLPGGPLPWIQKAQRYVGKRDKVAALRQGTKGKNGHPYPIPFQKEISLLVFIDWQTQKVGSTV